MGRLFGTDGVRGLANADLTPELATALAAAAARVVGGQGRPVAVVGRDTRASGEMLEAAVVAGLASAGADVWRAGVLPTPAVAHLTAELGADLGVMLSASHNPMPDNGVKFFAAGGHKLADADEDAVEDALGASWDRPVGPGVGRVRDLGDAAARYLAHLSAAVPARLDGLRGVVDCAPGAASVVAPAAYRAAGAQVSVLGAQPDGLNINAGVGSTSPEALVAAVRASRADVGIAHDGDADRCLAVDAEGRLVDGDAILAICALALREAGRLAGDAVVTTVMTNLGFRRAMDREGIRVVQTAVGDRHVLAALHREGIVLGGEQSGHLVFLDRATTGDGLLTALHLLARMAATGAPLAELAAVMRRLPQVLVNVAVADRSAAQAPEAAAAVAAAEGELGRAGRVLVRASGTEPLVRIMVEAPSEEQARALAAAIAAVVPGSGP